MAYPFAPAVTWRKLIEKMSEHDVVFNEQDPGGAWDARQGNFQYFEKAGDGFAAVCFEDQEEPVAWSLIRSYCDIFEIDPSEFGLDLG